MTREKYEMTRYVYQKIKEKQHVKWKDLYIYIYIYILCKLKEKTF